MSTLKTSKKIPCPEDNCTETLNSPASLGKHLCEEHSVTARRAARSLKEREISVSHKTISKRIQKERVNDTGRPVIFNPEVMGYMNQIIETGVKHGISFTFSEIADKVKKILKKKCQDLEFQIDITNTQVVGCYG